MGRHKIAESKKRKTFNLTISGETFENVIPKLREIARREGVEINDITEEFWKVYISEHGDGNPNYTMEHYISNPNFLATPALMRDRTTISDYLHTIKGTAMWDSVIEKVNEWVAAANEADDD